MTNIPAGALAAARTGRTTQKKAPFRRFRNGLQECHRLRRRAGNPLRDLVNLRKIVFMVIRNSAIFQAEGDIIGTDILKFST